jgi:SAM-dependent methyltransferase
MRWPSAEPRSGRNVAFAAVSQGGYVPPFVEASAGFVEPAICIACGEPVAQELTAGRFDYVERGEPRVWSYRLLRCHGCGMARLYPTPSEAALLALYGSDYDAYRGDAIAAAHRPVERLKMVTARLRGRARQRAGLASAMLGVTARVVEVIGARSVPLTASIPLTLPKTAAILDYGCGAGFWLSAMLQQGYSNLCAYDVEQPALKRLEQHGVRCFSGDPPTLPREAFECIRLEHVLEHLRDPVATLRLLKECLAERGTIVLTVPNFGSSSAARLGLDWRALKLPHHLSQFTTSALQQLSAAAGLQIRDLRFLAISEVGGPRHAKSRVLRQLQRVLYHRHAMDSPSADYVSLELEKVP